MTDPDLRDALLLAVAAAILDMNWRLPVETRSELRDAIAALRSEIRREEVENAR